MYISPLATDVHYVYIAFSEQRLNGLSEFLADLVLMWLDKTRKKQSNRFSSPHGKSHLDM